LYVFVVHLSSLFSLSSGIISHSLFGVAAERDWGAGEKARS
jgi:hypothetical protein